MWDFRLHEWGGAQPAPPWKVPRPTPLGYGGQSQPVVVHAKRVVVALLSNLNSFSGVAGFSSSRSMRPFWLKSEATVFPRACPVPARMILMKSTPPGACYLASVFRHHAVSRRISYPVCHRGIRCPKRSSLPNSPSLLHLR